MTDLVPCHLSHLVIDENSDQQTVWISERGGERRMPIVIGALEAMAIDRGLKKQEFPRPLTHDLLAVMLARLEARLVEVRIRDFKEGTFFADLVLAAPQGEVVIDCRPSDALALLLRCPGAALRVAAAVLAEAGG